MGISLTIVRMRYKSEWDNPVLGAWLRRCEAMGATVRDSCFSPRVDLTRNMEVGRWLTEDRTEYLLTIDSDMVPMPGTASILMEAGDCLFCPYVDTTGKMMETEKVGIGTGCMRVSRGIMMQMPQPWFTYVLEQNGRTTKFGEAFIFLKKLKAAGIIPRPVGGIGHAMMMVACPPGQGHIAPEWKFIEQFRV